MREITQKEVSTMQSHLSATLPVAPHYPDWVAIREKCRQILLEDIEANPEEWRTLLVQNDACPLCFASGRIDIQHLGFTVAAPCPVCRKMAYEDFINNDCRPPRDEARHD